MFQFTGFASHPYVFRVRYSLRSGFPHSDISGSKLHCQLPRAFRRLARPSSPVIAKASTTCTYSLDPITLSSLSENCQSQATHLCNPLWLAADRCNHNHRPGLSPRVLKTTFSQNDLLTFFHFVKELKLMTKWSEQNTVHNAFFCFLIPADFGGG